MVPMSGCKCNDPECPARSVVDEIRRTVATIGVPFTALEASGGLTIFGMLAIKNDASTFSSYMKRLMHIPDDDMDLTPEIEAATKETLNSKDVYGNTPMHYWAAREDQKEILTCLLQFGGCLRIHNNAGQRGIDIMREKKLKCIANTDPIGVVIDTTTGFVDNDIFCCRPTSDGEEEASLCEVSLSDEGEEASPCEVCLTRDGIVLCELCNRNTLCSMCEDYGCPRCFPTDENEFHEGKKPRSIESEF